jgi:hypothetical protein
MLVDPLSLLFWPKGTTQSFWPSKHEFDTLFFRPIAPLSDYYSPLSTLANSFLHNMKKNNLKKGKSYYHQKKKKGEKQNG